MPASVTTSTTPLRAATSNSARRCSSLWSKFEMIFPRGSTPKAAASARVRRVSSAAITSAFASAC